AVLVLVLVLVVQVRAGRDAVVAAVGAGGGAEPGTFAEPAGTDRAALAAQAGVRHAAVGQFVAVLALGQHPGDQGRRPGMTGHAVVAGLAVETVEVQGQRAGVAVEARHRHVLVGAAAVADFGAATGGGAGGQGRHAAVHHIHRAADGAAAIEQ